MDTSGVHEAPTPPQQRAGDLSQVLSTISHEIKNPLASLKLNAQMISRAIQRGQAPRIESAQLLTQAIDQLDRIASELSDAVRVDSDHFTLALKPVDLTQLAQRVAAEAEATYQRPITRELPPRALLAQTDESRISQIIAHLLANAAKYTPAEGSITLAARPVDRRVRVEVRDEGPGIAALDLPNIFDAFFHGSTAPQPHMSKGAGLGLGLYIARRIVQRNGGEMGATSLPGQGACIWFTLPRAMRN